MEYILQSFLQGVLALPHALNWAALCCVRSL